MNNADLKTMYTDAELFSMDRDTRIALLQYEWAVSWDEYVEKKRAECALAEHKRSVAESERALAERRAQILAQGLEEGIEQGMAHINSLNAWLFENNRTEDVIKATSDPDYRTKLFKEYEEAHPQAE